MNKKAKDRFPNVCLYFLCSKRLLDTGKFPYVHYKKIENTSKIGATLCF